MITTLPLGNGSYVSESLPLSHQQCVNWYPVQPDAPALSPVSLFGTPGVYQVATSGAAGTHINRGAHRFDEQAYFVNGTTLYRLNSDHSTDSLGTISGSGRVSMADNGTQMLILVPGGTGYIFTTGPDSLATISDVDFTANGNPQYVAFVDGYFVCTTDEKKFIVSALNDGTSWDALDFGSAEYSPDGVVVPIVYKGQLFIGGERTLEGFTNIGGANFPFQRSGLFMDKGVTSPFSVVATSNTFMFIGAGEGEEPAVWAMIGNTTEKVSTQAIDGILQRLTESELDDVFAWSYGSGGHFFAGFNLPDTCIVLDTTTGKWHERRSQITPTVGATQELRFRANSVLACYGKLYVGDSQDGRIGVLDVDTYTEYGDEIQRSVSTQPFSDNMKPFFVPYIELTVESGVGNASATDPCVWMDISRDGKTWSDARIRKIGGKGDYDARAIWRRNGRMPRLSVLRFSMSDPVKPVIISLQADIRGVG